MMNQAEIIEKVQIGCPFTMLRDQYLDRFLRLNLNPEIGLDAEAMDRFTRQEFKALAENFHARGRTITLHAPFVDLSPGSSDPRIREVADYRFKQFLDLVPIFRPVTVVCHAGYDWKRHAYQKEAWIQKSLETWTWIGREIENHGSRMMLENVYELHPDEMSFIFKGLKAVNAGFCLDTGHQAAFSKTSLDGWLHGLGDQIGQLHIHDNRGDKDEHLALGRGLIDFESFFNQLKKIKITPPVITLEPHKEPDLIPSLDFLKNIWPW